MNYLNRLSRALPGYLVALDEHWLRPPVSLMDASSHLKVMYRRLLASKLIKSLTPDTKSLYTLKIAASDLFKGHKASYPSSVPLKYNTSYLCERILPFPKYGVTCHANFISPSGYYHKRATV